MMDARFNSLALAPSIVASTTNSSSAFLTEPVAGSCSRACRMAPASEPLTIALSLSAMWGNCIKSMLFNIVIKSLAFSQNVEK
jgi:hypothetical protein